MARWSSAICTLYFLSTALRLVLLQFVEYFLLLFDLSAVVLCFLVGDLYFELVVVQFFLLSLDLNAKLEILFFKALLLLFDVFVGGFFGLEGLFEDGVAVEAGGEFVDEFLALFSEHLDFYLVVGFFQVEFVFFLFLELRSFDLIHQIIIKPGLVRQAHDRERAMFEDYNCRVLTILCNCMDWKNKPNQIFNKVKQQMYAKGVETFTFVDQFISQFDPQHTGVLTSHFFNLFLNKIGVFLTTQEIRNIRDLYSQTQGADAILYRDFLEDVKYSMSEKIANLIGIAYDWLDSNHEGSVSLAILQNNYNATQHPHVLTRRKAPEGVVAEFMSAISRKGDQNGRINRKGFVDYYAELNFCVPNERQTFFEQLIVNTWNIKQPEDYVPEKRLREIELTLYEKIREKSDGKTNEWKAGKKALFYFDLEDRKNCRFPEFKKGLDKFGCNFKEHELKALFGKYAEGGELNYQAFAKAIMEIDINGMITQTNLLQTKMGTNHFKVTH